MRYIKLNENIVQEIIPEFNPNLPGFTIQERYSPEFVNTLIPIENDDLTIEVGMGYDESTNSFYTIEKQHTPSEAMRMAKKTLDLERQNRQLERENKKLNKKINQLNEQLNLQEECLVEMANIIYA